MTRRYFVSDLPHSGGVIRLPDSEAQHALRVMRVQVGQTVTLFDGCGRESKATIESVSKRECICAALPARTVDREPSTWVELGIALPKPDRAKELVERLTELGVKRVTPIVADRTQRKPSDSMIEKLNRIVIEACKQSGRNELMVISEPIEFQSFCSSSTELARWIAHPDGPLLSELSIDQTTKHTIAIGPEGGWAEEELEFAFQSGFQPIGLGKRIYRVETAAVVTASQFIVG